MEEGEFVPEDPRPEVKTLQRNINQYEIVQREESVELVLGAPTADILIVEDGIVVRDQLMTSSNMVTEILEQECTIMVKSLSAMEEFNNCLDNCGLLDLVGIGNNMSWCNGHSGVGPNRTANLVDIISPMVSEEENIDLCSEPSEVEIRDAIVSIPRNSSTSPDGFDSAFFQDCWDIVKEDMIDFSCWPNCSRALEDRSDSATSFQNQQQKSNEDVAGLMAFKKWSVAADPEDFLRDWNDTASASPCLWRGVSCSPGGRVTDVDLGGASLIGRLHLVHLLTLPNLRHLNLHGNSFSDNGDLYSSTNSSLESCGLETLDLSSNNLSSPLGTPYFQLLLSCNGLFYLNLSYNSIPGGFFNFGASLLQLDLSHNRISDSSILTYSLSHCQNLNLLNLSHNKIPGELHITSTSISSLCKNLLTLNLSYNTLSGEISGLMANFLPSLNYLNLSQNNFSENFSDFEFGECSNLTMLDLSNNGLSGSYFPMSLTNCQLLDTLDLSHNDLQYKNPGVLLGNLKNLRRLSLAYNQLSGEILPELGQVCGTLEELNLSGNRFSGGFPSTFVSCSSLQSLDLGNNQLSGDFLNTVISTLPTLKYLYVPFNNITGPVPPSLTNCTQLQVLDLSSNALAGSFPSGFCSPATQTLSSSSLQKIYLPNNFLSGLLPSELANCRNLKTIDLSLNSISGPIPSGIWKLPNISELIMWANNLSGEIPEDICINGGNLRTLILNNNLITGTIPLSVTNCTNLMWLSLSSNKLAGEIPCGFGNLPYLSLLQLGDNMLSGQIPGELGKCPSLFWLDLHNNNLTGPVPSEFASHVNLIRGFIYGQQLAYVKTGHGNACKSAKGLVELGGIRAEAMVNMIHSCPFTRIYVERNVSLVTNVLTSYSSMVYLDLSYNSLSGTIPESLGSAQSLTVLSLGHNKLTGIIPDIFGSLKEIMTLDLSHNYLHGPIPPSLQTLSFLNEFNVSNNNLTGPIPSGGQLSTFQPSSYENNSVLCGLPLPPCDSSSCQFLSPKKDGSVYQEDYEKSSWFKIDGFDWRSVILGYGFGTAIGIVAGNCMIQRKEKKRNEYHSANYKIFSLSCFGPWNPTKNPAGSK
ncbi:receptor-like protein kinase BRI1-like 3 [Malania oleifera]|uniref:receptor-like protein kinase BRI1-like 3 n=1 Tax=Malania oleifera TaxID=397392 RepID=UPI0025AEAA45|nr:receptor-like protein kinase BRI1-like 3 [Malania oleifera]